MTNPSLKEFVLSEHTFPLNSCVTHEDFEYLYVRKNRVFVRMESGTWICEPVVQIANVTAKNPGNGSFQKLVDFIVNFLEMAVYVENAHNPRFQKKLLKMGFIPVNQDHGPNYIFNHENKLKPLTTEGN